MNYEFTIHEDENTLFVKRSYRNRGDIDWAVEKGRACTSLMGHFPMGGVFFSPAIRYISRNGVFVFERPPFRTQLNIGYWKDGEYLKNKTFDVQLPWQVYVAQIYGRYPIYLSFLNVFFHTKSLTSLDERLSLPPITNTSAGEGFCLPSQGQGLSGGQDITQFIHQLVWESGFNADIQDNMHRYTNGSYKYFENCVEFEDVWKRWSELSFEQVMNWSPTRQGYDDVNLRDIVARIDYDLYGEDGEYVDGRDLHDLNCFDALMGDIHRLCQND